MVGNFENVGFAKDGKECLYNIYMMEEVHSIFVAGAGAVTKLVDYAAPQSGKKSHIERLFNPKYPYEYLESDGGASQADEIVKFYGERELKVISPVRGDAICRVRRRPPRVKSC